MTNPFPIDTLKRIFFSAIILLRRKSIAIFPLPEIIHDTSDDNWRPHFNWIVFGTLDNLSGLDKSRHTVKPARHKGKKLAKLHGMRFTIAKEATDATDRRRPE